ncbi:4-hydroxybenzoate octaprenyltransferase [Aspergillus affinis]|uniref:4-hydroxybenzoate octaprenyltransferase n=1 Tax=Aspergillus affinis TaxID=1070780 RepID=UPI0022FE4B02|nr:UbiA prenyltransferase [Aspergillus affinis]KAI9035228.1 UbiA prenyltransferase [Aspergillus affinis]
MSSAALHSPIVLQRFHKMPPVHVIATEDEKEGPAFESLGDQYGGNHKSGMLSICPAAWVPYVQLARLFPPAGLFLIYFPHAFGILHAALRTQASLLSVLQASAVLFAGSFFFSNAAHIWNDLIDAGLDAQVERTSRRPIPRGAISPTAAFVFAATQAVGAAWFLAYLPQGFCVGLLYALPNILATMYYPLSKRHTHFPQLVLGVCLAWGTVMGELAMSAPPFTYSPSTGTWSIDYAVLCLFLAGVVWTVIYDTVYAHQDLQADLQVGIKSLAVLCQSRTKVLLWPLLAIMVALLVECGMLSGLSPLYYLVAVGGATIALGTMITKVDLLSSPSCWWWFSKGFWWAGGSICGGLFMEYVVQSIRG